MRVLGLCTRGVTPSAVGWIQDPACCCTTSPRKPDGLFSDSRRSRVHPSTTHGSVCAATAGDGVQAVKLLWKTSRVAPPCGREYSRTWSWDRSRRTGRLPPSSRRSAPPFFVKRSGILETFWESAAAASLEDVSYAARSAQPGEQIPNHGVVERVGTKR